jgi:hypothetical protein
MEISKPCPPQHSGAARLKLFCLSVLPSLLQGFLPADWDGFIADVLYPSFSPQMLLFLGMSSAYGLYKTGK